MEEKLIKNCNLTIEGLEIIEQGSFLSLFNKKTTFYITQLETHFDFIFLNDENDKKLNLDYKLDTKNNIAKIIFTNFNNPLGTTISDAFVGHHEERNKKVYATFLITSHDSVSGTIRCIHYIFYYKGDDQ